GQAQPPQRVQPSNRRRLPHNGLRLGRTLLHDSSARRWIASKKRENERPRRQGRQEYNTICILGVLGVLAVQFFSGHPVTAPSLAECTVFAYFASTPRFSRGGGFTHAARRFAHSASLSFASTRFASA